MKKNYATPETTEWYVEPTTVFAASPQNAKSIMINPTQTTSGHGAKSIDFSSTEFEDDLDF